MSYESIFRNNDVGFVWLQQLNVRVKVLLLHS